MFILGSLESQRRRLNKIWPPARGLALHNKRFTIEKIIKIVATRCQILRLKYCTKSFVGWGSAPDPAGGAYRVSGRGGEGAGSTPKLKLGPQNYFLGAGAVESAYWTSC